MPQRAVQQGAKGHFAWVVGTERKVEPRPVTLADWYGNDVFVSDGLRPGDQVVVDGGLTLRPGDVVAPKPLAVPAALGAPTATPPAPSAAPPASSGPAAPTKPEPPKAAR